jgi:adenosylcobinamide-GDP ribazoletransferase
MPNETPSLDPVPAPSPSGSAADPARPLSGVARSMADFLRVFRFYARLPLPVFGFEPEPHGLPDFARASWAVPLAGAVIGLVAALVGLCAYLAGLSTTLTAILSVATLVIVTGALHEDGLADCCDGLWGGATPARRLEIMKDSRIGTFGAIGLCLSLALRIFSLAELFRLIGPSALLLMAGIAAASRPLALIPALILPPARKDGLGAQIALPAPLGLAVSVGIGLAMLAASAYATSLVPATATTLLVLLAVMTMAVRIFDRKLGGYTGDSLGACQQLTEITFLLGLSAAVQWTGPV